MNLALRSTSATANVVFPSLTDRSVVDPDANRSLVSKDRQIIIQNIPEQKQQNWTLPSKQISSCQVANTSFGQWIG